MLAKFHDQVFYEEVKCAQSDILTLYAYFALRVSSQVVMIPRHLLEIKFV